MLMQFHETDKKLHHSICDYRHVTYILFLELSMLLPNMAIDDVYFSSLQSSELPAKDPADNPARKKIYHIKY